MRLLAFSPLQRGGAVAANGESFRSTYFPDGANTVTFEHEAIFKDNGFLVSALLLYWLRFKRNSLKSVAMSY